MPSSGRYIRIRICRRKRVSRRDEAQRLRADGISWRKFADALDVPMATVIGACREPDHQARV